jgi:8-oxo-dGTP diphosphatase
LPSVKLKPFYFKMTLREWYNIFEIQQVTMPRLERPILAVDVVLLCVHRARLRVLLHRRTEQPFRDAFALPGVAIAIDEPLASAARRALTDKAGFDPARVDDLHLEQLATFDALFRDPRGRTIAVAHIGLCREPGAVKPSGRVSWTRTDTLSAGSLPFDHDLILNTAVTRLRGKVRYTNIASQLLPDTFRIDELQAIYEAILGRRLNRANFRTKLLKIHLIAQAGVLADAVGHRGGRPPHLYRFASGDVEPVDRDFL